MTRALLKITGKSQWVSINGQEMIENSHVSVMDKIQNTFNKTVASLGGRDSMRLRALDSALWTSLGYGIKVIFRFFNRALLSYWLVPDMFGIMTIVNTFLLGLEFFSDVGITPNIVQSKRGEDPIFLNTAWTMQIVRGVLMWVGALLLAWPVSRFYGNNIYLAILPVAGLTAVLTGLKSTKIAEAQRSLQTRKIVIIELIAYFLGLICMIAWAWAWPSVWALVVHSFVQSSVEVILSHFYLEGHRNKLTWDNSAAHDLYRFGRWIFFSTAFTYLVKSHDKLILGRVLDEKFLGIYAIAIMLAQMVQDGIGQLGFRVLLPSYSKLSADPVRMYALVRKTRIILISLTWIASLLFMAFGREIVSIFGSEYQDAGWMLETLAAGSLVGILGITYENVLIAQGRSFDNAVLLGVQMILQLAGIFIGLRLSQMGDHPFSGSGGVVIGIAAAQWVNYPFKAVWLARLKLWQPEVDLIAILMATIIVYFVYFF